MMDLWNGIPKNEPLPDTSTILATVPTLSVHHEHWVSQLADGGIIRGVCESARFFNGGSHREVHLSPNR